MKNWLKENWSFAAWSIIPILLTIIGIATSRWDIFIVGVVVFAMGYFRYNHDNPLAKPWVRLAGKIVIVLWIIFFVARISIK